MNALWIVPFCYLLGSFPTAYIAGRIKGMDIRKLGDGNVGATNVYRHLGPAAGWAVFMTDIGKGAIAVLIAQAVVSQPMVLLCGFAAVVGHNWSVFLGFRGGRGGATTIGVLSVLLPRAMLILFGVGLVPFIITRNTLLGSIILLAPLWLVAWLTGASGALIGYSIALPSFIGIIALRNMRNLPTNIKEASSWSRK